MINQLLRVISIKRLVCFCMVGLFCTIINYAVFYFLYTQNVTSYLSASIIGFMSGVLFGYPMNRHFTYRASNNDESLIFPYCLVYILSAVLSLFCLKALVEFGSLKPTIANIAVIGLTTCTNYLGVTFIVFGARTKNPSQ